MKTLVWILVGVGIVGAIVYFLMNSKKENKAPVVVAQAPSKQTAQQKASEWIGVSGSAVDAIKNIGSLFGGGTAAASAT